MNQQPAYLQDSESELDSDLVEDNPPNQQVESPPIDTTPPQQSTIDIDLNLLH